MSCDSATNNNNNNNDDDDTTTTTTTTNNTTETSINNDIIRQSVKNAVYFAAKDGLSIAIIAKLSEIKSEQAKLSLINEVVLFIYYDYYVIKINQKERLKSLKIIRNFCSISFAKKKLWV